MGKTLTTILLVLLLAFAGQAQNLGLKSVGGNVGIILPENPWDTGFKVGGVVNMGELANNLTLVPGLAYWSSGYTLGQYDLSLSNFAIGADVHYYIPNANGVYFGGGLNLNFLSVDYPTVTFLGVGSTSSSSDTKIGITLLGGYQHPFGNVTGVLEAKYNIISDFNTFEITVGALFDLN